MTKIEVSDGIIFIPHNPLELSLLFCLSFFIGEYEKTCENKCYPIKRRLKII
jgi:hypothetical protein